MQTSDQFKILHNIKLKVIFSEILQTLNIYLYLDLPPLYLNFRNSVKVIKYLSNFLFSRVIILLIVLYYFIQYLRRVLFS